MAFKICFTPLFYETRFFFEKNNKQLFLNEGIYAG